MNTKTSVTNNLARGILWSLIGLSVLIIALFFMNQVRSGLGGSAAGQTMEAQTTAADSLLLTEWMAQNVSGLADEAGLYSDWIEIHNPTTSAIDLADWALTDDPDRPDKWSFPAIMLESGGYLIVFASGKDQTVSEPFHTNFKLNDGGEFLGLYHKSQGRFSELTYFPPQLSDVSYGFVPGQRAARYFDQPTPGQTNDAAQTWVDVAPKVEFSRARGFYAAPFELELSNVLSNSTIRYTLDGSAATADTGLVYSQPIPISHTTIIRAKAFHPEAHSSLENTHTYIFVDDVLQQSAQPPGFPETWGFDADQPVVGDYEMDPEIINDPRYRHLMTDSLTSIPSLSLVMDIEHFDTLYANPQERGVAWERPASLEYFDPQQPDYSWQTLAGLRIQGGWGRFEYMSKHSFRLFFKADYGPTKLPYPLAKPIVEVDTLVLRGGVNRSFAGAPWQDQTRATYIRDEWMRASQIAMSGLGPSGDFVHLYINGLYWGLYNVVERPDASFAAAYLGGEKEDWFAINHSGPISGNGERFAAMQTIVDQQANLDENELYTTLSEYIDIDQFIDYMILNWYAGNDDWPDSNWYAAMSNPSGKAMFFVWDAEHTWWDRGPRFELIEETDDPDRLLIITDLFKALMRTNDFRVRLADRIYKHLFNDGALTNLNAQARWQSYSRRLNLAIISESARWGDVRNEKPIDRGNWRDANRRVLDQMDGNVTRFIAGAREWGYYPDLDPPLIDRSENQITLQLPTSGAGLGSAIYYTTDGSDPRVTVSGEVAPQAIRYVEPVPLQGRVVIKTRAFANGTWSALNEAIYVAE